MADNRKGSGFVNLQRIVGANLGNRLGERVSSGIKTAAERAKSDVEGASSKFQQESQAAAVGGQPIQSRLQGILNPASSTQAKISDEDITFAKDIAEGRGYKGPTSLQDAAGISARAQSAEGLGQAARTAEGRSGLLSRFVGSPSYTSGQRNLDTTLLGRTAAPQVREAAQATRGLTRQADEASVRAGNIAAQRQAEAAKLGQEFKGQVTENVENIRDIGLANAGAFLRNEQRLAQASDYWSDPVQVQRIVSSIRPDGTFASGSDAGRFFNFLQKDMNLSKEQAEDYLKKFNLPTTPKQEYIKRTLRYEPSNVTKNALNVNQIDQTFLSDDQKARANALASILGTEAPYSAEDFGTSAVTQGQVRLDTETQREILNRILQGNAETLTPAIDPNRLINATNEEVLKSLKGRPRAKNPSERKPKQPNLLK